MRKVFIAGVPLIMLMMTNMLLAQQQIMNNDSVIRMTKAGLSENIIITNINTSPGAYNTSVDGLIALQEAGVSEKVIAAIQAKADAPTPKTGTFPPYEPPAPRPDRDQPATRPPAREARNSQNDGFKQNLRVGMKVLVGVRESDNDNFVCYGPSVGIWIKNRVGIESGMLTYTGGGNYLGWDVSARAYVIPVTGLFTVANINAGGLHIRPYVGGGVNISTASGRVSSWLGDYDSNTEYKVGGQGIFGAQFTVKAVRRLSFGPEFGYYRIFESNGTLAGVTVNFYIF